MSRNPRPEPRNPASTYDVLTAWQAGRLSSRRALALTNLDFVSELYAAALDSNVPIRQALLPEEERAADRATTAIKAAMAAGRTAAHADR
jgi:hypothetical protein